jgi:hypothetical protein
LKAGGGSLPQRTNKFVTKTSYRSISWFKVNWQRIPSTACGQFWSEQRA